MNNKMCIIFILVFVLSINEILSKTPRHQFGVGGSTTAGAGLSYQWDFSRDMSLCINGFVYYYGDKPPDDLKIYSNIGGEWHYNLYRTSDEKFYSFIGFSYWQLENRFTTVEKINDIESVIKERQNGFIRNFGLGGGYEIIIEENFSLSFNLGIQIQSSHGNNFYKLIDRSSSTSIHIGPSLGIYLRYVF